MTFTIIRTKKCNISHFFELKSVVAIILPSVYKDNRNRFLCFSSTLFLKTQANKSGRFGVEHLASAHRLVRLDEVDDVIWHLIVASPRDVLHLVVDDDWRDVVLLLEDFICLGGEGCGGVEARDGGNGC